MLEGGGCDEVMGRFGILEPTVPVTHDIEIASKHEKMRMVIRFMKFHLRCEYTTCICMQILFIKIPTSDVHHIHNICTTLVATYLNMYKRIYAPYVSKKVVRAVYMDFADCATEY